MNANDEALRWKLRGLRQDLPPQRDLWPAIAGRIATATQPVPPARRDGAWAPLALAASLVLVAGLAWRAPGGQPAGPVQEPLLQREATALARQYQGALEEFARLPPARDADVLAPSIAELDRSAAQILDAIERDPHSRLLLAQLHRTYARRLQLAQRATLST
jgi:hypothetical protein